MLDFPLPVIGFAAFSGTGKTTLLKKLIPLLRAGGLRPGIVKHAHHRVEFDVPGKDSYELRKAGAGQVLLASERRWALMAEEPEAAAPGLSVLLERLDTTVLDLVLVEGFRHLPFPKIELHRPSQGKPLLCLDDETVIAIAADGEIRRPLSLPLLDLNDPVAIMEFIKDYCREFRTSVG